MLGRLLKFPKKVVEDARKTLVGNVGIMAISWFLFALSSALVQPFFARYAQALGASDIEISYMRFAGLLVLAIVTPLGGMIADAFGRVRVIILGTFLVALVQFLYAVAPDWRSFAAVWVLDNAFHFYQPALSAIVMDSLPSKATMKGFVYLNAFSSLPWLFMPAVGGLLFDAYGANGVRMGFVVSGITAVVVAVLRIKGLRETLARSDRDVSRVIFELAGYRPVLLKAALYFAYTAGLFQLTNSVLSTYGSIYAVDQLGLKNVDWGLATIFASASSIVASLALAARMSVHSRSTLLASSAMVAASQAMIWASGVWRKPVPLLYIALVLNSLGGSLVSASISSILTHVLPREVRGRAVGIQRTLEDLGASLASLAAGYLYTSVGPSSSFLVCSLFGTVATLYLALIT